MTRDDVVFKNVKKLSDIHTTGEIAQPFALRSGWAAQYHNGPDGKRQTLGFILPGEAWLATSDHSIVALTDCEVDYRPDVVRKTICDFPQSAGIDILSNVQSWVIALGSLDAFGKVAYALLDLFDRLKALGLLKSEAATIPLTQQDIADFCCLTSVHVNRVLRLFDTSDIIKRDGREWTLLQRSALEELACIERRPRRRNVSPSAESLSEQS